MSVEHNHRVISLTEQDRKNLTFKRESSLTTNAALLANAVEVELPRIVEALTSLGFSPESATRPARLPLTDLALASLRDAAEATGISQSQLLILSIRAYCGEGAPVASPTPSKAKTAPRTRKPAGTRGKAKEKVGEGTPRKTAKKAAPKTAAKAPRTRKTKGGVR